MTSDDIEPKNGLEGVVVAVGNHSVTIERPANTRVYSGGHHVHAHAHADPAAYPHAQARSEKRAYENWLDDDTESSELDNSEPAERNAFSDTRTERNGRELHRNQTGIVKTVEIEQSYV
jgi:hypothetical protein